ncbi:MAG: hypothetical protein K2H52_14015 [Lachnospiraceae bacterium]|nr:hypothetical protein [Lachnospiraceae bacterium]MDE7285994.1 hypothetical protein [Lachnospiraceae bacterium]
MLYSGIYCDECSADMRARSDANEYLPSKTHLIRAARTKGWSVGKRILCPGCRKRGKE